MSSAPYFRSGNKDCLRQNLFPRPGFRSLSVAQPEAQAGSSGLITDVDTDSRQLVVSIDCELPGW